MVTGQFSDRREKEKLRVRVLVLCQSFVKGGGERGALALGTAVSLPPYVGQPTLATWLTKTNFCTF